MVEICHLHDELGDLSVLCCYVGGDTAGSHGFYWEEDPPQGNVDKLGHDDHDLHHGGVHHYPVLGTIV